MPRSVPGRSGIPALGCKECLTPGRATVTTTTAEFWYGNVAVTRGEVTGVGTDVPVERGALAIRTSARGGAVVPLSPQP